MKSIHENACGNLTLNSKRKSEIRIEHVRKEGRVDELEKWGKHCLYNCVRALRTLSPSFSLSLPLSLSPSFSVSLYRKPRVNNTFAFECPIFFILSFPLSRANLSIGRVGKGKLSSKVNILANSSSMYLSGNCQTEGMT